MTGRPAIGGRPAVGPEGGSPIVGAEDVGEALRQAGGGGTGADAELRKEETLRERIAKIEEETTARERSDQDQLLALQAQRVRLTTDMLTAQGHIGGEVADEKTQLEATLAVGEKNNEIGKLSAKIEQDKLGAADKITIEREKEAAQAEQALADARESNKEFQFELAGHKDLAERAKIESDYNRQIVEAKKLVAYEEEQARQAAERGDLAERDKWDAVAGTNRALVEQLSLEEQNALAAHDKAQAEKDAAAVAEVADRTKAVNQTNEELAASIGGHKDLYEFLKKEGDLQLQIDQAIKDANQYWSEGRFQLAQQNENLATGLRLTQQLLAAARTLAQTRAANDVTQQNIALRLDQSNQSATAASLNYQYEMNKKILQAQQDHNDALVQQLTTERDMQQQMNLIPAVQRQGTGITPGTDIFKGGKIEMGSTAMGLALAASGGDMTSAAYKAAFEHYNALEEISSLTGKNVFNFEQVARGQAALDAYAKQQNVAGTARATAQAKEQIAYWEAIAEGLPPPSGVAGTPSPGGAAPGGAATSLAQFTQLQHETAIQRITGSIPGLLSGSIPTLPSTSASSTSSMITRLEQQVSLLQTAVAKLTSIDGRLKPAVGTHG